MNSNEPTFDNALRVPSPVWLVTGKGVQSRPLLHSDGEGVGDEDLAPSSAQAGERVRRGMISPEIAQGGWGEGGNSGATRSESHPCAPSPCPLPLKGARENRKDSPPHTPKPESIAEYRRRLALDPNSSEPIDGKEKEEALHAKLTAILDNSPKFPPLEWTRESAPTLMACILGTLDRGYQLKDIAKELFLPLPNARPWQAWSQWHAAAIQGLRGYTEIRTYKGLLLDRLQAHSKQTRKERKATLGRNSRR